jgi:hypothetical protein
MRLDKNTVAGLGLPEGISDKIHFDAELSGFGYRVRRSTSGELLRSYVAQYRSNGASKRLLIGDASRSHAPKPAISPRRHWPMWYAAKTPVR